jgi:hypothetical protein
VGKRSREKWERKIAEAEAKVQPAINTSPRLGAANWASWIATFALAGAGIATSNGPWEVSGALFLIAIPCTWIAAWILAKNSSGLVGRLISITAAVTASLGICWTANQVIRIPIDLGESAGRAFTRSLGLVPSKPDQVLLSCSSTNESACALAEKFIAPLQRAGWKVDGPKVERLTLGRYGSEVVIADYGPPLVEPQNPDLGVWTKLMPWRMPEETAFRKLGIKVHPLNDPDLSESKTRIYFGSVPTRTLLEIIADWSSS